MKNYKEVADSVFERRNQYEKLKRQKTKRYICATVQIFCICMVAVSGVGMWKSGIFTQEIPAGQSESVADGAESGNSQSTDTVSGDNSSKPQNSSSENNDTSNSQAGTFDLCGVVYYNGRYYVQKDSVRKECVVVRDKKIGTGNDFEGNYNYECLEKLYEEHGLEYRSEYYIESEIYTVKDNPDLLCVVLSNGGFVVLEAE